MPWPKWETIKSIGGSSRVSPSANVVISSSRDYNDRLIDRIVRLCIAILERTNPLVRPVELCSTEDERFVDYALKNNGHL